MIILYFVFGVALQESKSVPHMSPGCCQTPVLGLGLGFYFIFPLSQQEVEQAGLRWSQTPC